MYQVPTLHCSFIKLSLYINLICKKNVQFLILSVYEFNFKLKSFLPFRWELCEI